MASRRGCLLRPSGVNHLGPSPGGGVASRSCSFTLLTSFEEQRDLIFLVVVVFIMGQRHQLFIIARLGKHYRSLAAVHHQWLYGVSALRACLRLLRIFSDPSNRLALKHELDLAAAFYKNRPPPPSQPAKYQNAENTICPFPFILTCLAVGVSYDSETGRAHTIHELRHDMGYDQGDNNDGITVLDITDLDNVRYCFVNLGGESSGELTSYGLD